MAWDKMTKKAQKKCIMFTNDCWWWWCFVNCKLATYLLGWIVFFVRVCRFFCDCQIIWFLEMRHCIPSIQTIHIAILVQQRAEHNISRLIHVIFGFVFIFSVMIQLCLFLCFSAWISISLPFALVLTSILFYWAPNGLLRFNHVSICRCVWSSTTLSWNYIKLNRWKEKL